ncbi:hypothetical protein L210DRAFT_3502855 [Boletus edulis BED1]|uniref:Uncharacterized protein n=1 Tax=Boletus edulis BED1 TaxID=1328754 RepID=A0AAD4BYL7_BOLED|nr:hypothetical protein L210DRAFT_3502855 [Boletus edulis BED1]
MGTCLISGFEMVHGCIILFDLVALSGSPETSAPLMDNWTSDSLPVFWAKRWHIGKWLAGDVGMLFGTFLASGMYYECSAYILGKGFDWSVVLFFMAQAILLLAEKLWRRTTARQTGGIYARLWVHWPNHERIRGLGEVLLAA